MSEFEAVWESSRYNMFYYLSWVSPALVLAISVAWKRWVGLVVGFVCSFVVTFALVCLAVETKWSIRRDAAHSPREIRAVADRDSANLAFAPIHAFLWGLAGTLVCSIPAIALRNRRQHKAVEECEKQMLKLPRLTVRRNNQNPYDPPSG